jgi:hypothetical protein
MTHVYITPDRRARCLSRAEDPPPQPFELVASFEEQDAERAWVLLHELGGQPSAS